MAESHVVSGLVAKRSEMSGLILHHKTEIQRLVGDLSHIDATIKLFAPEFDLRTVRAKEHRERNHYFRPGERPRMVLDILREYQGVMTTRQIAEAIILRKGLESSAGVVEQLQKNVLQVVKDQEGKGTLVQGEPDGVARTWRIA